MKIQKGFIQIPILLAIIAGAFVLGVGGYFGVKQYQNYQVERGGQEKLQEFINLQSQELRQQKDEIETLKKNPTKPVLKNSEISLADLIEYWAPNIAKIKCLSDLDKAGISVESKARYSSYGMDIRPVTVFSSGFLTSATSPQHGPGTIAIYTNRHVLNTHNGFGIPYYCEALLPGGYKYIFDMTDIYYLTGEKEFGYKSEIEFFDGEPFVIYKIDAAFLRIKDPDINTVNLAKARSPFICTEVPRIGEDVVILGYPSIGSSEGITATDGIISGLEEFYFVTSAKVEHGNSGGAAILKSRNCYLGIPTFARSGSIESLARILKFNKFFR